VEPGDEVLVTSFSFIASASPIIRAGAIPVFVDIDPATFLMDLADLSQKITPKSKAIIGVHLFGQLLDFARLEAIASENKLVLIEDAAQGFGSESGERKAGGMGDISCFSFDPTKIVSAYGSGGAVLTDSEDTFRFLKKLRYHGKSEHNEFEMLGYNSRLSDLNCAHLSFQITEHLAQRIHRLNEIARLYQKNLQNLSYIRLPENIMRGKHVYHKYVIRTGNRDELKQFLAEKGIATMVHYSKPLYEYPLFSGITDRPPHNPLSKRICGEVLSLPIFPELSDNEIDYICNTIHSFKS
jgi:dTDP-4-amino-4,6-dideoxygalactose transaminase